MRKYIWLVYSFLISICFYGCNSPVPSTNIPTFRKITIDTTFRSESITAADLNKDGLKDLVIGDVWYEAPDWKMHEIRPPGTYLNTVYSEAKPSSEYAYYSNSFAVQVMDVNQDGWEDVVVFPVMNQPIYWYENPQNTEAHWKERKVVEAYHGESPLMVDLLGNGQKGILAGVKVQDSLFHLCWITPSQDPDSLWNTFTIGSTAQKALPRPDWDKGNRWYAAGSRDHGLGFGDMNGDGRKDVLTSRGWYEAPLDKTQQNWTLHYVALDSLADAEHPHYVFAQMPIFDINADGNADFFGTNGHRYGLWWFEQQGPTQFVKHELPIKMSQVHAVAMSDLNQNGIPDLITGKRYLSHTGKDPGFDEPLRLLWLESKQDETGKVDFQIKELDEGTGVGTQIEITDLNGDGREDILTSSKKGTYVFWGEEIEE